MTFCTITPSRGNDRPAFLEFCRYQLSRMNIKPDKSYFIDYEPESNYPDLIARIQIGAKQAIKDGFKYAFIIEEDDFYDQTYFASMVFDHDYDLIGSESTIYYNLLTQRWEEIKHRGRSSLFHTGINLEWLQSFDWPPKGSVFLDIELWKQAKRKKFVNWSAIGLKGHGQGLIKTKGHSMHLKNSDPGHEWLKKQTGEDYQRIIDCL